MFSLRAPTPTITPDLLTGLSKFRMKNEEAHIDTVRDDEDIDNGDVDDDEDDDEDEVIEIKMASRRSSSSSLNSAADVALRSSTEIHISDEFIQEQLGQKPSQASTA